MKRSLLLLVCVVHAASSFPSDKDKYSSYAKVRILASTPADLELIQRQGVDLDHYTGKLGEGIEVVINQDAIEALQRIAFPYEVLVPDMDAYYKSRAKNVGPELDESRRILHQNGINGFRYGSMGGFLTYGEMILQLDTMRLMYPNLITAKESLGVTEQGRTIWGVEISDNPGVVEPGEAVVHYDALHHAREPQAMATIMYYMYWLLDNYGTDPEATYLVNNRRMCFVPVVNPDGYFYNQSTNPNGGGNWRKNRRNNGNGSYGVDLNRNYNYMWGYDNTGSSPTPSSDTYRGPSPLSEPEAVAIRNYTMSKQPSVAMSAHSVAGRYLNPYSFKDTVVAYEYYAQFASDFTAHNNYLYGTVVQMLAYNSNGTTRDYLHHDLGCYAWTPEMGGSGFWPLQSEIVPIAQENLLACKYLSWISGAFADFQSFRLVGKEYVIRGDTLRYLITLRNKGVSLPANDVAVSVQSLYPHATAINATASYPPIDSGTYAANTTPFAFRIDASAITGDEMKFVAVTTQEGIETSRDTFSVVVGYSYVLFEEDGENGIGNWTRGGNGVQWDTTFVMAYRGSRSITDSRYGNVANSTNNTLTLTNPVNLLGMNSPRVEFVARWANESQYDYVRLQLSTNNGSSWINLAGRHTTLVGGQPSYSANKGNWAWESISLLPYAGQQVRLRFNLVTDAGLRGDGFYFDEFRIVDYRDSSTTGVSDDVPQPLSFSLSQNYPNPFNPSTTISFSVPSGRDRVRSADGQLPTTSHVTLKVFDLLGKEVATLVDGPTEAGEHAVQFNGRDLSSGVYFYRMSAGAFNQTRALVLVK
ncbi:MAG: immune inhibitor A [Bacteroidetes bacterium]|nr:immune inhibitor A [Bacteroidota bacterium]MCW5896046.1 immune inhibitor A [Bacteroidota bacterium]